MIARGIAQAWAGLFAAEQTCLMQAAHAEASAYFNKKPAHPMVPQLRQAARPFTFWAGVCGRAITAVPAANDP